MAFGPGIIWIGIGGLYGHHRRADNDALRERLTSGAMGNVLFADDPYATPRSCSATSPPLFPRAAGVYVLGSHRAVRLDADVR